MRDIGARITVPAAFKGEVAGLDGTRAGLDVPELRDRLTIWTLGRDMTELHLDLAGVIRMREQLGEAAAAMLAAG